jgi:hypothetical protein
MPIMVLEKIKLNPITRLSVWLKPNRRPVEYSRRTNTTELASVTRKVLRKVDKSFFGCISKPSKNSKKIMPNLAMSG